MNITLNLNFVLAIISIVCTTTGAIVAILKIYGKIVVSLNNINNTQVHTNERLTKIETFLLDLDERIDENSADIEENAQQIELINQKCNMTHEKEAKYE